jgi:two-component system sensor histidine kinase TctE
MRSSTEALPSIRRRLLRVLLWPALVLLLAGALIDFFSGLTPVGIAYDHALIDAALAVAAHVRAGTNGSLIVDLPPSTTGVLRTDPEDSIFFRVSAPDGHFIAGDSDLPHVLENNGNPSLSDSTFRGEPIRRVTLRTHTSAGPADVTVAETVRKRQRVRMQLLSTVLAVDLVEIAAILVLAWLAVRFGLRPLDALRAQIAGRSARELAPLAVEPVPTEVRGVVEELNRLFATVRDSSRAQRQFLENAAHQLRTPLTGLQAQLELLAAEESARPVRPRVNALHQATRRLAHTAHQLLALARSEQSGGRAVEFEELDLTSLVEATVSKYFDRLCTAGLDPGADVQPAKVIGVPWLLQELMNNLIENSLVNTPAGGAVTARCGTDDQLAFLEVLDTGVGIPEDERELVIQRFFRGRNARGDGSGLGLAIVSEIARLHGGRLAIGPGRDGRGTRVRVIFPAS